LQQKIDQISEKCGSFQRQNRELEMVNDQWENSNRILEYSKADLEEKLNAAEENLILYQEEINEV
jgi:hypothetical protein